VQAALLVVGLLVAGVCFLLAGRLEVPAESAGFGLQTDNSSSMLRDTSAEAPPAPDSPAPHPDLDRHDRDGQAAAAPLPLPPGPLPAEPPVPLPVPEAPPAIPVSPAGAVQLAGASAPAEPACAGNCVEPRGVSPMLRTWRTFVLPTFVIAALVTPAAPAGEKAPDKNALKPIQDHLDEMNRRLDKSFRKIAEDMAALKKEITGLAEERTKLAVRLQKQISDLKTDLDLLKSRLAEVPVTPAADRGVLEEIRSRLAQMELTLQRLQAQKTRVALSPPAQTGRVLLVNSYATEILFIVNSQSLRVEPGATLALERVPAGSLTYEAISPNWGPVRRSTTTLAANETLTLVAR
jgi:hypothetical protein